MKPRRDLEAVLRHAFSLPIVTPIDEVEDLEADLDVRAIERQTTSGVQARAAVRVGTSW